MQPEQRSYIERSLAIERSKRYQKPADHAEWTACGFTTRVLCRYNKFFVVWQQVNNAPKILGRFRVLNMELDIYQGLGLCIETTTRFKSEDMYWVSHTPSRLFDLPVFAHVPYLVDLSYLPLPEAPENPILRIPLVIKTASNPGYPVEGHIYVSQVGEFRATYPEFADLRV